MKEKEGFTLKKVITAVMAGAIVGYMLYEADVVDKVIEINQEQRIELCGPNITAVHGNEYIPTLVLASMGVEQVVTNPVALAKGVRYTEKDLNASFGTGGKTYEEERARELMEQLDTRASVIDFHTFSCKSDPFAEVYGRIAKHGKYANFVEEAGMVPVLYGERAYDNLGFYGLAAREITGTIQAREDL